MDAVKQTAFVPKPKKLALDPTIDVGAKACYDVIYHFSTMERGAFPSLKTIASFLGKSEDQTSRYIKVLQETGWIAIQKTSGRRNKYTCFGTLYHPHRCGDTTRIDAGTPPAPVRVHHPHRCGTNDNEINDNEINKNDVNDSAGVQGGKRESANCNFSKQETGQGNSFSSFSGEETGRGRGEAEDYFRRREREQLREEDLYPDGALKPERILEAAYQIKYFITPGEISAFLDKYESDGWNNWRAVLQKWREHQRSELREEGESLFHEYETLGGFSYPEPLNRLIRDCAYLHDEKGVENIYTPGGDATDGGNFRHHDDRQTMEEFDEEIRRERAALGLT